MCKYVSYKAIKNLLEQTENDIAKVRSRLIDNLHHTEYDRAIIDDAIMFNNLNATKYVLVQMLELCKEIKPNFDNLVEECNKPKQCKDCRAFFTYANKPPCEICSKNGDVALPEDCTHACPKLGFCVKYKKFVDEDTECLDEEE